MLEQLKSKKTLLAGGTIVLLQRGLPDAGEIDRILHSDNLTETGRKPYHHFSLGMKQRLGLAQEVPSFLAIEQAYYV